MGSGPGMPTVIEKGHIFLKFDQHYEDPWRRWAMLVALKTAKTTNGDAVAAAGAAIPSGLAPAEKLIDPAGNMYGNMGEPKGLTEAEHVRSHWFGEKFPFPGAIDRTDDNWFGQLASFYAYDKYGNLQPVITYVTPVPDTTAADNLTLMRDTMIEALEISLGLHDGEGPPAAFLTPGTTEASKKTAEDSLKRSLPLDIYWICGKSDGFEAVVSWNPHQVSVFFITPPLEIPVHGINDFVDASLTPTHAATEIRRNAAKDKTLAGAGPAGGDRGMVALRRTRDSGVLDTTKWLLQKRDGGVTPDSP